MDWKHNTFYGYGTSTCCDEILLCGEIYEVQVQLK